MQTSTETLPTNDPMAILDGATFTTDEGIQVKLRYEAPRKNIAFGGMTLAKLHGEPTAKGKRTEAYRATKSELRDDWSFDFTETVCDPDSANGRRLGQLWENRQS